MLTASSPASRSSSCKAASLRIANPTSGGSSDSETSDATVRPRRWPRTSTERTATPAGKRPMTARSSSPPTTPRSYEPALRALVLAALVPAAPDLVELAVHRLLELDVGRVVPVVGVQPEIGRARLNSSHEWISYAVFCLKKKKNKC